MRFIFITEEDPFYVYLFFQHFFAKFHFESTELMGIVILAPFYKKNIWALAKKMYHFYGIVDFIRMGFKYLIKKLNRKSIRNLAQHYHVSILDVQNVNDAYFLNELRKMDIELVISVAAPQKFKEELLQLPNLGCINIHSGKLPKYRGMMPSFWTLLHDEEYGAVTIHKMNENLDDGEIILQQEVKIKSDETLNSYIRMTKKLGAEMMLEVIRDIGTGNYQLKPNDKSQASYFSFPNREDVKRFRSKGKKLL